MNWFKHLAIRIKLFFGFTSMLLFISGIGATCYFSIHRINAHLQDIFALRLPAIDALLQTDRDLHRLLVAERTMIIASADSESFEQLGRTYERNLLDADQRWSRFKELPATSQERTLMTQYEESRSRWLALSSQVVEGTRGNSLEGYRAALDLTMGKARESFEEMRGKLDQLIQINLQLADKANHGAQTTSIQAIVLLLAIVTAAILAGMVLALLIGLSITQPLNAAVGGLKDIAEGQGDLTQRLAVRGRDEVGELSKWINAFMEKLQEMVRRVMQDAGILAQSAQSLSSVATEMALGAGTVAARSDAVASAAEEMSANIGSVAAAIEQAAVNMASVSSAAEEMRGTIAEVAKHTEKASTITQEAVSQTEDTTKKMDQLGEAARSIGKVTEVITEISEQTNLLALNATIEAARAGEAGKGFAVVANEIKELARQTAAATQEIKGKINGIQRSTEESVRQIGTTSKIINDINEIVSTIASASEEQSTTTQEIVANVTQAANGIQEVSQNISQVSSVSSSIAEDIAGINQGIGDISERCSQVNASALELRHLSASLNQRMECFKV